MDNKEKETTLAVADYNIEKNMKNAKIAIGFFIVGFIGVIAGIVLRNIDIGDTFWSGLVRGISNGVSPAAIFVGLMYAYSNMKKLREEKIRLLNKVSSEKRV